MENQAFEAVTFVPKTPPHNLGQAADVYILGIFAGTVKPVMVYGRLGIAEYVYYIAADGRFGNAKTYNAAALAIVALFAEWQRDPVVMAWVDQPDGLRARVQLEPHKPAPKPAKLRRVRVGRGTKIHAAVNGPWAVCGAGQAYNRAPTPARDVDQDQPITCERCREYLKGSAYRDQLD